MHTPGRSERWGQRLLKLALGLGLVDRVRCRALYRRGGLSVWFLSERGHEAVEAIGPAEPRRKLITTALAAGTLQAHTLAVNDVGLAFMEAAGARGDRFGPLGWHHELGHRMGRRRLITDAVLHYLISDEHQLFMHSRFLELDRGTMPERTLAEKIADYAYLRRDGGEEAWKAFYPAFPGLLVVLTGLDRPALQRRLAIVIALCSDHPALRGGHLGFPLHFALLEDVIARGPFAPVFASLEHDGLVDWLGHSAFSAAPGGRS